MTKLIFVEAVLLILIGIAFFSYVSYGGWDQNVQPQATDQNTTFWNLNQTYPLLNLSLSQTSNTTYGGVNLDVYDVSFDSNVFNNSMVEIHGVLLKAAGSGLPAVLLIPAEGNSSQDMIPLGTQIASKGYVVLVMDPVGSGNSTGPASSPTSRTDFTDGPYSSYYYQNVISAYRAVTVLKLLPYVDSNNIGVVGVSEGGATAFILSSIDSGIKAAVPMLVSGYFDEIASRGSLADFLIPTNVPLNSTVFDNLTSYFDLRGYAQSTNTPTLMLVGANDEYYLLDQANATYNSIKSEKAIIITPNSGHYIATDWNASIIAWLDHYLQGKPMALQQLEATDTGSVDFYTALNVSTGPLFANSSAGSGNYGMSIFYRYSIPGLSWSESSVNLNNNLTLGGVGMVPLPPLPTNVDFFLALKSNGTVISTSPVYQTSMVSSYFVLIVVFLVLVGLLLAANWRSEIGAYTSSDVKGAMLFVMSLGLWIIAAISLTMPWIDIPGKTSLNLLQMWDRFSLSMPSIFILFALLFLALAGYAIRMWLGGLILVLDAAIAYIALASLNLPIPLLFAWGAFLYGACVAVSLLIPALIKVVRG